MTNVVFSFPAWEHTVHHRLVSKKIGKSDGGIGLAIRSLMHLDGRWFGQDSFQLEKLVLQFLIDYKGIHKSNIK